MGTPPRPTATQHAITRLAQERQKAHDLDMKLNESKAELERLQASMGDELSEAAAKGKAAQVCEWQHGILKTTPSCFKLLLRY